MINGKGFKYVPGLVLAGSVAMLALTNGGCSAANTIAGAAGGCDEFKGGASSVASLSIDGSTKAFVGAAADLEAIVTGPMGMEVSVMNACIAIDKDLGVTDSWSAMAPTDGSAPDNELKEACNQATTKINAILMAGASAQVTCNLSVSGGQCTVDASVQADCQGKCTGAANCTPPDVTVACDPGQLSGQCSGMCNASATCEGSASVAANCQGSCEADCQGTCTPGMAPTVHCEGTCMGNCTGTCTASGGTGMMVNAAACSGTCSGTCSAACMYTPGKPAHCDGSCTGTCTGNCKLDANAMVSCGAMVNCKGGCSVMYTAPKCEGEIKPPMCNADANCQASCQGHAEATATCTKPTVTLECDGTATADITKLIATLQTNLPAIVAAVQTQGPLAVKAVGHVFATGSAVVSSAGSIGGKALACATAAASASVKAQASISVSVSASASVSGAAGGPMS
jgi:hypothetical protein